MQMPEPKATAHGATVRTLLTLVSLAWLTITGPPAHGVVSAAGQEPEALRIDVTLDEYSFSPDPLRIPAGRPVTLVIHNAGHLAHEFMAGRDVEHNDFVYDLFADLHVNIEQAPMEHTQHTGAPDHEAHQEHAEHAGPSEHDGDHAHGEGHEHGTMVEAKEGETFFMTFTLPEDRRGAWTTGCFLPGHYEAGMHGALIVE